MKRRKVRVKWLWSAKPRAAATSPTLAPPDLDPLRDGLKLYQGHVHDLGWIDIHLATGKTADMPPRQQSPETRPVARG